MGGCAEKRTTGWEASGNPGWLCDLMKVRSPVGLPSTWISTFKINPWPSILAHPELGEAVLKRVGSEGNQGPGQLLCRGQSQHTTGIFREHSDLRHPNSGLQPLGNQSWETEWAWEAEGDLLFIFKLRWLTFNRFKCVNSESLPSTWGPFSNTQC